MSRPDWFAIWMMVGLREVGPVSAPPQSRRASTYSIVSSMAFQTLAGSTRRWPAWTFAN
jgi:hypothetical protein